MLYPSPKRRRGMGPSLPQPPQTALLWLPVLYQNCPGYFQSPVPPGQMFSRQTLVGFEFPHLADHHPQILMGLPLQNPGREEARRGKCLKPRLPPLQTQAEQPLPGISIPGNTNSLAGRRASSQDQPSTRIRDGGS